MLTFQDNDTYTRSMRDRFLVKLYDQIAYEKRYCFLDGKSRCAREVQKTHHFDTLVSISANDALGFEEKIRRTRTEDFLIETKQSTRSNAPGWVYTSAADVLSYSFPLPAECGIGLDVYLMDMEELQQWFDAHEWRYMPQYGTNSPNVPEFYIIRKSHLVKDIAMTRYWIDSEGCQEVDINE